MPLGFNDLTLLELWREYSERSRSIPCLLMPWLLTSPGHQQPWYWPWGINWSLWSMEEDLRYLRYLMLRNYRKCKYVVFPQPSVARKGFKCGIWYFKWMLLSNRNSFFYRTSTKIDWSTADKYAMLKLMDWHRRARNKHCINWWCLNSMPPHGVTFSQLSNWCV